VRPAAQTQQSEIDTRRADRGYPEPKSLRITGTVEEWQIRTKMRFPEHGDCWFPHGLATAGIDHAADQGSYWEPNVWMNTLSRAKDCVGPGS
jgi:hypothetical protein